MKYSRSALACAYVQLTSRYSSEQLASGIANVMSGTRRAQDVDAFGEDVTRIWGDVHDTVIATVSSAYNLSVDAKKTISSYIQQEEGKKHTAITYTIDPSLIGGAVIQTPTHTYDFSVHGKLTHL